MASISHQANAASERLKFRTSTRLLFFELPQYFKWYLQRTGEAHKDILKEYISIVTRGIAPVVPHTAEEAWSISGEDGFVLVGVSSYLVLISKGSLLRLQRAVFSCIRVAVSK